MNEKQNKKPTIENEEAIKKLLILQLLTSGVPAELIAKATGMNPNSIRNMFPLSKYKTRIKSLQKNLSQEVLNDE